LPAPQKLKIYVTDHLNSQVVCKALATGSGGQIVPATRLLDGPGAVYGILRGCDQILKESWWVGRNTYHVDHGYIGRGGGDFKGYYRITCNGLQVCAGKTILTNPEESLEKNCPPGDRLEALGVKFKPWRKTGEEVVIAPLSKAVGQFLGIDPHRWLETVINEVRQHTDRSITIKPKDSDARIQDSLRRAWCLVTHSSNSAIDALIEGVPVFVTGDCASKFLASGHFSNIEKPRYPDREPWFRVLSYSQWQLSEIQRGRCWEWL
jgi:hypothetical protein